MIIYNTSSDPPSNESTTKLTLPIEGLSRKILSQYWPLVQGPWGDNAHLSSTLEPWGCQSLSRFNLEATLDAQPLPQNHLQLNSPKLQPPYSIAMRVIQTILCLRDIIKLCWSTIDDIKATLIQTTIIATIKFDIKLAWFSGIYVWWLFII